MSVDFFKAVLPTSGYYCLVLLPEGKHIWTQSLDALAAKAESFAGRTGVYFGTAAFASDASRKAVNVLALRSLRLDIDAGEKKYAKDPKGTYPSQKDALVALRDFIAATRVKPSYIVSSGQGLHVYYCLDRDAAPSDWLVVAEGLRAACAEHALRVDPTVTCDTARILRPVGGLHSGENRVRVLAQSGVVHSLADLSRVFAAPVAPTATRKYDTSINDDAISTVEGPPSSATKVAQHCAALAHVAQARGDVQEPLWRAMLGLVKFTVEGAEIGHEWSKGYSGYDADETDRKIDGWLTGPTTCAEFEKHCDECGGCQHRGNIKSPIVLGRMTVEQIETLPEEKKPAPPPAPTVKGMPWDGKIPQGFDVVEHKGINTLVYYMETERESETGEMVPIRIRVPITHEIFWFDHWSDSEGNGDAAVMSIQKWDDVSRRTKTYAFDSALLASRSEAAKKLGEFGIHITTDKRAPQALEAYLKAEFQIVKNSFRRVKVTDRFGLRILDDGSLVAVQGKYVIMPDGSIEEAVLGSALRGEAPNFNIPLPQDGRTRDWGPEVWDSHVIPAAMQHVQFMRDHYTGEGNGQYQLAFMLALSSPLMAFVTGGYRNGVTLPGNGISVSLYEREGGKGKTTLMQSAMLAFGNPEGLTRDQNAAASTDLARIAKLSMLGTMPASFDEMGRTGEKSVANLISSVANGSGRERATREGGLITSARWALICLVSTNRSQREMVTANEAESSAVQYRLIELDMNKVPDFSRDQRAKFTEDWANVKDCAGALGAVIQREICAMGVARVNKLVMDCVNKAAELVEADKEERFQYRALGAMLATHAILNKLGMVMFDLKGMLATFREANESAKAYIKENTLPSDNLEILQRALHDLRPQTIVTEDRGWLKGRETGRRVAVHIGSSFPQKVSARYIRSEAMLYVSVEALKEWLRERHLRVNEVVQTAKEADVIVPIYPNRPHKIVELFNLYTGMLESTKTQVRCYAVRTRKLAALTGGASEEDTGNVVSITGDPEAAEEAA